jgi:hypothetical protein
LFPYLVSRPSSSGSEISQIPGTTDVARTNQGPSALHAERWFAELRSLSLSFNFPPRSVCFIRSISFALQPFATFAQFFFFFNHLPRHLASSSSYQLSHSFVPRAHRVFAKSTWWFVGWVWYSGSCILILRQSQKKELRIVPVLAPLPHFLINLGLSPHLSLDWLVLPHADSAYTIVDSPRSALPIFPCTATHTFSTVVYKALFS